MNENNNNFIDELIEPFQRFFKIEASGGILILLFTCVALIWVNTDFHETYNHLWHQTFSIGYGKFIISKSIVHWINDGLMTIFFFVIGLEIKREILAGELSSFKQASLPLISAIGGMVCPAVIFIFLNNGELTQKGWGIPMATDIAFSLGILSLLGKRVPLALKVFLVAFAIVDDLGAILIITFFYSANIQWTMLLISLLLLGLLFLINYLKIQSIGIYIIIGIIIWYFFLRSGVHPTLSGMLVALTIPANRRIRTITFLKKMEKNLVEFGTSGPIGKITLTKNQLAAIDNMEDQITKVQSPLQELEHSLHGFVTYIIMPLFVLTNAGIIITNFQSAVLYPLSLNIEASLIFGKVIGITLFSYLGVKSGIATLPTNVKWQHIIGLGFLGGMGFTMSLFIANLAFNDISVLNQAKFGILLGSILSGIIGYLILRTTLKNSQNIK